MKILVCILQFAPDDARGEDAARLPDAVAIAPTPEPMPTPLLSATRIAARRPWLRQPGHPTGVAGSAVPGDTDIFPGGISLREKPIRFMCKFDTLSDPNYLAHI